MKVKYSSLLAALLLTTTYASAEGTPLTPPNAKPGECYARVLLPAQYETVEENVMIKEPSEKISIVPAEFTTVSEEVEVKPATKVLTPIPATYKEVKETIEVKPAILSWKNSLKEDALPISDAIVSAASSAGIDTAKTNPGTCYREYFSPRKFKTISEEIMVRNEYNETEVIEPEFEAIEKTIIVKPASKEIVEVPAVYEETEEQVLVEAEKTVWKKGVNPAQKVSGATGEIMCLIKIPAKYKTIKKRVLKEPATTKVVEIPEETKNIVVNNLVSDTQIKQIPAPAVYETIEKTELEKKAEFAWYNVDDNIADGLKYTGHQICLVEEPAQTKDITKIILDVPASIKEEVAPATTEIVEVQEIAQEAKIEKAPIEAEYKVVKKRNKIAGTHLEWRRILCQTNMSKEIISKIQAKLNERGYAAGEPDGLIGKGTKDALDKFQRDNKLATGGITYETLDALGVKL